MAPGILHRAECLHFTVIKSSFKPSGGAYLFQAHLRGSYLRGSLFNLEKTMVSPERTRIQRGKAQVHTAEDQNQNRTSN